MKLQRQLSNGMWTDEDRVDEFIARAVKRDAEIAGYVDGREPKAEQEIRDILATGKALPYGQDWYAKIRGKVQRKPKRRRLDYPNGRKLDCGCTVYYQGGVMNASMGSSCEGCYDRMS